MIEKMHTGKSIDSTPPRDGHIETKSRAGGRDTKNSGFGLEQRRNWTKRRFPSCSPCYCYYDYLKCNKTQIKKRSY